MPYRFLPWLLEQEGRDFQRLERKWRPSSLLYLQQVREILRSLKQKLEWVTAAQEEFQSLPFRNDVYKKHIQKMRLYTRVANFTWKTDQLVFLQAVTGFYTSYGVILRFLKQEEARGTFKVSSVSFNVIEKVR